MLLRVSTTKIGNKVGKNTRGGPDGGRIGLHGCDSRLHGCVYIEARVGVLKLLAKLIELADSLVHFV